MNDNSQELEVNQNISEEFEKIMNLVRREMKNLKQIEYEMENFKKKLSKLSNSREDWSAKQNENNFEFNELKQENYKRDSPTPSIEMMGNMDLGNLNYSNLESLLKMNLLKKKPSENKIPQKMNIKNSEAISNNVNINVNDEQILKKLMNPENKNSNGSENDSSAQVNKNEKTQVDSAVNKVSENTKEIQRNFSGMSLSEIEKQLIMLKHLGVK